MLKSGMMRWVIYAAVFWTFSLTATPQTARYDFMVDNKPLSEAELKAAFSGKTHVGHYRYEREEFDSRTFVETTRADGRVTHAQGHETLTGTWRVGGERICYLYDQVAPVTFCFHIYKVGNCYYHVSTSNGLWNARSTPKGEEPDCEMAIT